MIDRYNNFNRRWINRETRNDIYLRYVYKTIRISRLHEAFAQIIESCDSRINESGSRTNENVRLN